MDNGHELEQIREMVEDREPGELQSMGSQRAGHDRATEQQTELIQQGTRTRTISVRHGCNQSLSSAPCR